MMKFFLILVILITLWGFPITVEADTLEDIPPPSQSKVVKTYFLTALPNGSRQSVKLDPPAMRLAITSSSGDTGVRCGDGFQRYNCSPGKRLVLEASDEPLQTIWAENSSGTQVRLRIDVLEEFDPTEDVTSISGWMPTCPPSELSLGVGIWEYSAKRNPLQLRC